MTKQDRTEDVLEQAVQELLKTSNHRRTQSKWGKLVLELMWERGELRSYRIVEETTVGPQGGGKMVMSV